MYKFEVYRVLVSLCVEIDQIPARGEVNDKHIDYYHDLKKQIALRIQHFVEHTHSPFMRNDSSQSDDGCVLNHPGGGPMGVVNTPTQSGV